MSYYQGDQYSFILKMEVNGAPMNLENVELIEFTIGQLSKKWPLEVQYNDERKEFYFPVTQQETFMFGTYEKYQARIKYVNGEVFGSHVNGINVKETLSRNII